MDEHDQDHRYRLRQTAMATSLRLARMTDWVGKIFAEIPMLLYSPELERAMSDRYYNSNLDDYTLDRHLRAGLFPFEELMLAEYFPKPPAHLLVPGAGTGRELLVLADRGYTFDAFEPVKAMVGAANEALAGRATVQRGTLQEWVASAGGRYDGIITGWGMWTHININADRLAAYRAFRSVCAAGAPLLLSFIRTSHVNYTFDGAPSPLEPLYPRWDGRLKNLTRNTLRRRLLRRVPIERGLTTDGPVFKHIVTEAEVQAEGAETGWKLVFYSRDESQYGHAVLVAE